MDTSGANGKTEEGIVSDFDQSRRQFIGGLAAAGIVSSVAGAHPDRPLVVPRRLKAGDTLALITPASPVFEPSSILQGKRSLESLGFSVKVASHVGEKRGYLAGNDRQRAKDLMEMFTDSSVHGIIALRGGFGSMRILPYLDYDVIRSHPKVLLGYSDITSLHLAIHRQAGMVTYHSGVALSTFNEYSTHYFLNTLTRPQPVGTIDPPEGIHPMVLQSGDQPRVSGPLVGGNLTLVCATLGTPYEIDTEGRILFLEEVGEEPYAMDRMLGQLKQAGKLDTAAAICIDRCDSCAPADYKPAFYNTLSLEEVISDHTRDLSCPVLFGLSIGHVADKPVLPLGIQASVNIQTRQLSLDQAAVRN